MSTNTAIQRYREAVAKFIEQKGASLLRAFIELAASRGGDRFKRTDLREKVNEEMDEGPPVKSGTTFAKYIRGKPPRADGNCMPPLADGGQVTLEDLGLVQWDRGLLEGGQNQPAHHHLNHDLCAVLVAEDEVQPDTFPDVDASFDLTEHDRKRARQELERYARRMAELPRHLTAAVERYWDAVQDMGRALRLALLEVPFLAAAAAHTGSTPTRVDIGKQVETDPNWGGADVTHGRWGETYALRFVVTIHFEGTLDAVSPTFWSRVQDLTVDAICRTIGRYERSCACTHVEDHLMEHRPEVETDDCTYESDWFVRRKRSDQGVAKIDVRLCGLTRGEGRWSA